MACEQAGHDVHRRADDDLAVDLGVLQPPEPKAGQRAAHDRGERRDLRLGQVRQVLAQDRRVGGALAVVEVRVEIARLLVGRVAQQQPARVRVAL